MKAKNDAATLTKEWYLSNFAIFENQLNGSKSLPLHHLRQKALERFQQLDFPTSKQEDWKYTNINPLLKPAFRPVLTPVAVSESDIQPFLIEGLQSNRLVFINGHFMPDLSAVGAEMQGVVVKNLSEAMASHREIIGAHFARHAKYEEDIFLALNTAFAHTGAFVYVPKGVQVGSPLHLLFIATASEQPVYLNPRNLIILEDHAALPLVESYHHLADASYFNNMVTEIYLSPGASLNQIKIQDESESAYSLHSTRVHQKDESKFSVVNLDLGGALSRNDIQVLLDGEYCNTHLYGFYFGYGKQVIDNHSLIDHARPHCDSNELFRGILDDQARGVFCGKVMVRKNAQKTNAYQSNQGLLLTDDAELNSKPQLEIFADDVKCSHGATIGELDEGMLFYLRARGIGEEKANYMLRLAFAADVFNHIENEAIRHKVEKMVVQRFEEAKKRA